MTQHLLIAKNPRQRGITLVEVLISMFVISFVVLGAAALQVGSLKNALAMEHRAQATFLANDMLERMRAARGNDDFETYEIANSNELTDNPNRPALIWMDLNEWAGMVNTTLPSGQASIAVGGNAVTLTFTWQQKAHSTQSGAQNMTFVVEAMI